MVHSDLIHHNAHHAFDRLGIFYFLFLFNSTGLIFHFLPLSFDVGLKYFLDKKSYGALTLGVLF